MMMMHQHPNNSQTRQLNMRKELLLHQQLSWFQGAAAAVVIVVVAWLKTIVTTKNQV
jgi:hypothetical protein